LLEVLSVAARPIEQGVALEAAGLPTGDRAALLALRAARLIRTRGTRQTDFAETYHDRVRETVVLHMSTDRARDVHAKIARASEVWGVGEPEQLVVHYAEAGEGVRAGETAIHAARTAGEKLAFNRAADLYRKAIELVGAQDRARQRDLYEHLGDAYANAGRGAQAAEAYLQAADGADPSQSNALRRRAAQQLLRSGRAEQGTAIIRKQMRELSMEYPESTGRALALLLWNRSLVRMFPSRLKPAANDTMKVVERERLELLGCTFRETCVIDPLRGTVFQLQYLRAAMRSSDPMHLLNGLVWEIYNSAMGDGMAGAPRVESLLATARELSERVATPYAQALVAMIEGACALCYARFAEAIGHCVKAEALFRDRCPGTSWERSIATTIRYAGIELAGDLSVLAHEAHEQVREARERDDRFGKGVLAVTVPMAYLMSDDPDSSMSLLLEQSAELEPGFTTAHLWVMDRMADTYLYQQRYDLAFQYLESQWPAFQASFLPRAELLAVNAHFLRGRVAVAAASVCDATPRRAIATKHIKALRKLQRPDAQVYASLLEAALAQQAGDRFATVAALSHARDTSLAHGYENYALYSAWNLGIVGGDDLQTLLRREAGKKLLGRGVISPQRWVNTYAPGFTLR
jgi:tetratricopeptide (TPR) repeat protein